MSERVSLAIPRMSTAAEAAFRADIDQARETDSLLGRAVPNDASAGRSSWLRFLHDQRPVALVQAIVARRTSDPVSSLREVEYNLKRSVLVLSDDELQEYKVSLRRTDELNREEIKRYELIKALYVAEYDEQSRLKDLQRARQALNEMDLPVYLTP